MAVGANDLLQDVARTGSPDKWLGFDVVVCDIFINGRNQFRHAAEYSATKAIF